MQSHIIITIFILLLSVSLKAEKAAYKQVTKLMGVRFELTAVSDNEKLARESIDEAIKEIKRIEDLISSWNQNSETSEINRNAGLKAVKVSSELFDLIVRSKKISALTNGLFDISFASVDKIWKFDGSQTSIPSEENVKASVAKINYQNIILNKEKQTVFLKEKGMKIGFGAIGKGYAANKAKAKMLALGIKDGVVNAGGDLITWGKMEHGGDWSIGIANPKEKDQVMGWLIINDLAVVTSGNYEKFFIADGKKYSHIINPTTGYPASGTRSVTIICKDAELSDALATSVFILGASKGIELINQLKNIECLVVTAQNELKTSNGLKLNYYKENAASSSNIKTVK
mgnify:FL=1